MTDAGSHRRFTGSLLFGIAAAFLALTPLPLLLQAKSDVLFLAIMAALLALFGGYWVGNHPTNGIAVLWAACGMQLALGVIGIFTVGLAYIIAAIMTLMAISAAPNPDGRSWFGLKFILPEIATFVGTLAIVLR